MANTVSEARCSAHIILLIRSYQRDMPLHIRVRVMPALASNLSIWRRLIRSQNILLYLQYIWDCTIISSMLASLSARCAPSDNDILGLKNRCRHGITRRKNALPLREHYPCNVLRSILSSTMRIIAKSTLRAFWNRHPNAEEPLLAWYRETEKADWANPAQVKAQYRSASFVGENRVIFNIKGNDYRLVVKINYPYRVVYVRFVGTHAEYDKIDVGEV